MAKYPKITLITIFVAVVLLLIPAVKSLAAEFIFSDDFSSDFNIDAGQSKFYLDSGALYAPDNYISSRIVSNPVIYTSYNTGSAKLEVSDSVPTGGRIVYFLSNDNGATWVQAQLGNFVNFSSFGKIIRWSATIARQDVNSPSPYIGSVKITAEESDPAIFRNNDSRRVFDLSLVSRAISDFYKDYGIYPHISGSDAKTRWSELMTLLLRNRNGGREPYPYLYSTVSDPLESVNGLSYDYKDLSPNDFILAATFESPDSYNVYRDIDGNFSDINCNDPVYCTGVLRNYTSSSSSSGVVLGASTSSTTTRTVTTSGKTSGLDLDNIIANPLNNLIGYEIFRFGDYNKGSIYNQENTTIVNETNNSSANNSSAKKLAQLPLSGPGGNGRVAGVSISKAAEISTGTKDSLVLSLALSGLATLVYAAYTRTNLFKRREALAIIKHSHSDKDKFNFA